MRWIVLSLFIFLSGCTGAPVGGNIDGKGYAPVYISRDSLKKIVTSSPRPTQAAGKIYAYKNYIFQNDQNLGIHIIDNSIPLQPKKVGFIDIPLSTEVAVKGDFLYSNNYDDLVVFDISKPSDPKLLKRIEDVFPAANQDYPPYLNIIFECADPKKGVVIRWELKTLSNPKCRR